MKAFFIFLFTLAYSILRYNIAGDVNFEDIPSYVCNKAVAFSMIIFLLLAAMYKIRNNEKEFDSFIQLFKFFALIHILFSMVLFSPIYYPKLYDGSRLSLFGNLTLAFGVVSAAFIFVNKRNLNFVILQLFIALHLFFIGAKGWLTIEKWNGYMPPITLICFIIISASIVLNLRKKAVKKT